jgi:hypothetical protein
MHPHLYRSWQKYIYNLDDVAAQLEQQSVIAVGVAPYPRIVPALFMSRRSYQIYCVKNSKDLEVMRNYATVFSLEERAPKVAEKVKSTNYLLRGYAFQGFLKSRKGPYTLLFYQPNTPIVTYLNEQGIPWIGNDPKSFEDIMHKEPFREALKKLRLNHLPDWNLSKQDFLQKSFDELFKRWQKPLVCQPADYEVIGSTRFIHTAEDLAEAKRIYGSDEHYNKVNIVKLSPFVVGETLSMLGCVTEQGVLTSTLQLQLIDIPESLHGYPAGGTFFGHDWGFRNWSSGVEADAQVIVEVFGEFLYKRGYRGIFGIDFIYDIKKEELYPLECNPRFTGAIPVYSMINIANGVPPIDFFTIASFLDIDVDFDFEAVNEMWKKRVNASHIALTPQGIDTMPLDIPAGIYKTSPSGELRYQRPGAFLHELKNKDELIVIDQIPLLGEAVMQNVPRLFKLVIPQSIAIGSKQIKPYWGAMLSRLQKKLRKH